MCGTAGTDDLAGGRQIQVLIPEQPLRGADFQKGSLITAARTATATTSIPPNLTVS